MGDVDKLQVAEEAAAQRAEEAEAQQRERRMQELRETPLRPGLAARSRTGRGIPLAAVHPGDNIRLDLPEIQELALSIREMGLLTPLIVRPWDVQPGGDGELPREADPALDHYRLVAGHRRHAALTALVEAGLDEFGEVPCEVREGLTVAEAYALMLTENVQRVPLEPIQAARALRLLLDLNEGMDAATLARSLGLRPAWTTTHLKLLDLPQEVQDRVESGDLSVTIADLLRRGRSTGRIDEDTAKELARKVASGEITSAEVRQQAGPPPRPSTPAPRTVLAGAEAAVGGPGTSASWQALSDAAVRGRDVPRPPTPLSAEQRQNPYATGDSTTPTPSTTATPGGDGTRGRSEPVIPYEDRLDAYLLGRALREWADEDYLDELGIDRVQAETYATMLGFEERVAAIRQLSATLMERDAALVGAC